MQRFRRFAFAFLISFFACALSYSATAQVLRFGVIPEEPEPVAQKRFAPLLKYLEARGLTAIWIPIADVSALVDAVVSKRIDFAWMNGFTFVQARARMGGNLIPIAQRAEDAQFKSVILSNDDSIKAISDAQGKSILFGPRSSVPGHIMPRLFMHEQAPDVLTSAKKIRNVATNEAVAFGLAAKQADIGAMNAGAWARMTAAGRIDTNAVKVIATTPAFTDYCYAIPADRDPALITALQNALIGLNPRITEHAQILHALRATRIIIALPESYDRLDGAVRLTESSPK